MIFEEWLENDKVFRTKRDSHFLVPLSHNLSTIYLKCSQSLDASVLLLDYVILHILLEITVFHSTPAKTATKT